MSKNSNHKLELINTTFIPKWYNCIYSPDKNTLIYPISSNIIIYNLSTDTKTIINNKNKSNISNIKFLDKEQNILLIINKSQFPLINIISINNNNDMVKSNIFSKIIPIEENFHISNIFIDRFRYNLFLILLSGINKNILYFFHLTNMKNNKYSLIPNGILQKLYIEVIDFKSFYNSDLIICTTRNSMVYYKINLENQICSLYKRVQLQVGIKSKSLKLDRKNGFISIITSKGECLIYDKEGNNINNIKNPLNNDEYFCFNIFSEFNNSLCLVTNKGNILLYEIENQNYYDEYNFKIKKIIKYVNINQIIQEKYQLNKNYINNNNIQDNKNNNVDIIYYNEKSNLIMIYNNSLLSLSLSDIINKRCTKNSILLYQFNHNTKINSGIIIYKASQNHTHNTNNNDLDYDNIIYTCSNNNILNSCYYSYSNNKFISNKYNFNNILPKDETYITSIRFHPKYPNDILYLGDSKGCLYLIYLKNNFNYQKYNLNDIKSDDTSYENAINLITFSPSSEYILYIGFNNGLQKLYDLKVNKHFNYYKLLSNNYFEKNEIYFRKSKSHIINFCHFFIYKNNLKDCFAYLANQQLVKISKFENNNNLCISNSYNNIITSIKYNEQILDIKIHKSENYIITLNNKKQIIIKEISSGNIIHILDFNKNMNYIYNFDLDISGLYLSLICDFKNNNHNQMYNINSNKSSIAIIEISTGKIANYIKESYYPIIKVKFDYYGQYIISLGEKGELSIWKLNKSINNVIAKSLEKIKNNFYEFWENFNIRNNENLYIDNNEEIMDEMLTEELIDKEKYILEADNYANPEDFYRINNHGEKSIYENKSKTNSILFLDDTNNNMSRSLINNNNQNNIFDKSNSNFINTEYNNNDYLLEEDHYINRNIYNYKNSVSYLKNNNINIKYNKRPLETEIEKSNSNTKRRASSFSDRNKNIILKAKKEQIFSSTQKTKSIRDMIMNNKSRNKEKKVVDIDNDIKNLETPQFPIIQTPSIDNNELRLFSFNSNVNNNDNKDIFELKKKIIKQSSNLLYNQRRMVNLNNAMNKLKIKNPLFLKTYSNSIRSNKEEIDKENIIYNNDRFISLGKPNNQEEKEENKKINIIHKKYPEPLDIDNNLINIDINFFKNDKNIAKFENKELSNEQFFYINNKSGSNFINNNMNISDNSGSISLIKEMQNNTNNSFLGKNHSKRNLKNINNYNINDISNNNPNISVGEQISYLENNIKKFEKMFGK